MERKIPAIDWTNLILAIALFISPWVLGFAGVAMANAMITSVIIGAIALAALVAFSRWEEWANLAVGVWAVAAPWVVGFSADTAATWTHVVVGAVVAVLAAIELWTAMRSPPPRMVSQ